MGTKEHNIEVVGKLGNTIVFDAEGAQKLAQWQDAKTGQENNL